MVPEAVTRQAEELVERAAQDFDAFYDRPESAEAAASQKDLLVLSLDGKGILMRREELREATRKAAETEAERWVTERAFTVLQGRSSGVGAGIRRSATLRKLPPDKRVGADDCADYWRFHLDAEHARTHASRCAGRPTLRLIAGGASS